MTAMEKLFACWSRQELTLVAKMESLSSVLQAAIVVGHTEIGGILLGSGASVTDKAGHTRVLTILEFWESKTHLVWC
jgi:hypothetical protein